MAVAAVFIVIAIVGPGNIAEYTRFSCFCAIYPAGLVHGDPQSSMLSKESVT